jgi:hypothetical protein
MGEQLTGHLLKLDPAAETTNDELPAFLAPPANAPPYHGFPLVPETCTDGWCYGAIAEFVDSEHYPHGCDSGDGFVQAPDGSRAGLVWETDCPEAIMEVLPPDANRWGVWEVRFPRPISSLEDLIFNFRSVLPLLQSKYREVVGSAAAGDQAESA